MKTPDNAIDFEPVSIEDAAKVASPAEQLKLTTEQLDAQFATPVALEPKQQEVVRAAQVLESLTGTTPQVNIESSAMEKIVESTSINKMEEKKVSPEEFIEKYGIKGTYGKTESAIASELSTEKWGDSQHGALYLTIGGAGTAVTAYVATGLIPEILSVGAGDFFAGLSSMGDVALGAGSLAGAALIAMFATYGYKTVKNLRARSAFKEAFGKSVDEKALEPQYVQ